MTDAPFIELWRSTPARRGKAQAKHSSGDRVAAAHIFPSGRAALVEALRQLGLVRRNIVAVPPFSSGCVNGAVGRVAAPVLIDAAGPRPDAVLVYEQWGWPVPAPALARLRNAFDGVPIILDSVDVPFPGPDAGDPEPLTNPATPAIRVWSFGKVLGTIGGGLLTVDGRPVPYRAPPSARADFRSIQAAVESLGLSEVTDILRSHAPVPPDDVMSFVEDGELEATLDAEAAARRENAQALSRTDGATLWRPWMLDAIREGAAPGLGPLGIGESPQMLKEMADLWRTRWNVETRPYHFNISGDQLLPEYVSCLAVPLHSGIKPEVLMEAAQHSLSCR